MRSHVLGSVTSHDTTPSNELRTLSVERLLCITYIHMMDHVVLHFPGSWRGTSLVVRNLRRPGYDPHQQFGAYAA
ncbi:hypothetical protein BDZ89DRAFT_41085 [Hymenopellis radicata]|nr:hypothetical protein BDZ89DRAFT_41085 [Hymenopellis radicata]